MPYSQSLQFPRIVAPSPRVRARGTQMTDTLREPNVDRLKAAFRREKLDRVPHFEEVIDPKMTDHILGTERGLHSIAIPPEDAVELARRTCQDAVTAFGAPMPAGASMCSLEDIEKWEPFPLEDYVQSMKQFVQAVEGTRIGLSAVVWGPFFISYMAAGPIPIQDFLLKTHEDLEFVETILERILNENMKYLEAAMEQDIDFIEVVDDTCDDNGFLCAEPVMDRIWTPRMERLVRLAKQKGVPIHYHCCGKLDQVIPKLIDWGVDLVLPVQPKCNDIRAHKKRFGDKISFRGNINIDGLLSFGTPEEVRAEARRLIDDLSYDGGFVLSSSHSVIDSVPPENYFAMVETACDYGKY